MRFINLCTVDNSFEANFIKKDLAEQGIACIVTNENFTSLMPQMNGILGSGIQILVYKDDLEVARQVIEKRTATDIVTCPECGSEILNMDSGQDGKQVKFCTYIISDNRISDQTYTADI
jgi:DNA-directed RNA polymerase subunit RPC12/RpoP